MSTSSAYGHSVFFYLKTLVLWTRVCWERSAIFTLKFKRASGSFSRASLPVLCLVLWSQVRVLIWPSTFYFTSYSVRSSSFCLLIFANGDGQDKENRLAPPPPHSEKYLRFPKILLQRSSSLSARVESRRRRCAGRAYRAETQREGPEADNQPGRKPW